MKTSTPFSLACALIAGLTIAQDGEKPREGAPPAGPQGGPPRGADFIQRADANKDGKLSKEEFLEVSRKETEERFGKLDGNADGVADEAEIKAAMEKMRGGDRRPEGSPGMRRPEGSPEGRRPEGGPEGRRPEGSPEGRRPEGGGAPSGMRGAMGAMANPEEAFKRLDANTDGSVDSAEFTQANAKEIEGRFKALDQNADGKVGMEEFKASMDRLRGAMRGMGGDRGPEGRPGGEGGGFRRPPSQEGQGRPEGERPRPPAEGEGDKPAPEVKPAVESKGV
jgi:Ca2+-binding EF-hand superfamily protein